MCMPEVIPMRIPDATYQMPIVAGSAIMYLIRPVKLKRRKMFPTNPKAKLMTLRS